MIRQLSILLFAAAALPAEDKVIGGPYVVNTTRTSAEVMWIVQTGSVVAGAKPGDKDMSLPVLETRHVSLTNLTNGKTYYYDVFNGKEEGKGSFKTAPNPASPSSFEFLVYGDNRTRPDAHKKVVDAILKSGAAPDFVLQTGDMVERGGDNSLWPIFFDIERDLLRKVSFIPSLGNHERDDRNYFDFFDQKAAYYSFTWGSCHFSVIDSDIANVAPTETARQAFWQEQTKWLEEDLKANQSSKYRFVVAHHPPMTAVKTRQGNNPHMTALMPMLEQYKVTAGLFGHDHNYQHYLKNGIHYFINGGGGAPLYDVDTPPAGITVKVKSIENFLVFKVDASGLTAIDYDVNGDVLDKTEWK